MLAFLIIFLFLFIGEILHWFIPLPANVIGMILLTISLFLNWVKLEWIEKEAESLNRTMLLFFAPVIVGIMPLFQKYKAEMFPILISLVGSTLTILVATGWISTLLFSLKGRGVEHSNVLKGGEDRHV